MSASSEGFLRRSVFISGGCVMWLVPVAGAQYLLHVKTAIINGRLDRYTGHHSVPADIAA